jgi:hypothetical protein
MLGQILPIDQRVALDEYGATDYEVAAVTLIAEGKTFELHAALDSDRRHGMMPFSESLAALVRAYRKAPDREHFLAVLRRDGMDASISERLA